MSDEKKITKIQRFEDIKAILTGDDATPNNSTVGELLEFCDKEIQLLKKKNVRRAEKAAAAQEENKAFFDLIADFLLTQEAPPTCTDINNGIPELRDFNNQKVASLLRQMIGAGMIKKTTEKGKAVFTLT